MTKVIYFGNERLVSGLEHTDAPILKGLIEKGYEVVAVVSHHSSSNSRNQRELEVAEIAEEHDIPLFLPNRPSEILDELKSLNAEIAVLVAYGRIISQEVIDVFPLGIVNIHPSLLPKYRGPTPIESSIFNGDSETGVSIMKLTSGMDEGPVYAQGKIAVAAHTTKFNLYSQLVNLSIELLFNTLPGIINDSIKAQPQDASSATYSKLIQKSDSTIDWNQPAERIERNIRAYAGWPQSRTILGAVEVIVTRAEVMDSTNEKPGAITILDNHTLLVGTIDGALRIDSLKPLGKKEMPISAFLTGYRSQLGV